MKLNIVFCGTPEFATPSLQALLESPHCVKAVYTQPDRPAGRGQQLTPSPVKTLAQTYRKPIYQPENLREPAALQLLTDLQPDLIVVVAYGLMLPKAVLAMPRYGAINVHPSLLPRHRGATPIQAAILAGDSQTGVSIIQLTSRMDAGPILYQTTYSLHAKITAGQLHDELAQQGAQALLAALDLLTPTGWQGTPQQEEQATYTAKISKSDAELDWHQPAVRLARQVRAYQPWPVAFATINNQILRIWEAEALDVPTTLPPGALLKADSSGIDVATGAGALRLLTVQRAGGRPMAAADFIKGHLKKGG